MKHRKTPWIYAVLIIAMMVVPTLPAFASDGRASVNIIRTIKTFGDGSAEKTISFTEPGTDQSLYTLIPNGAKVLSAKFNVTNGPLTDDGTDYPSGVTIDAGNDGTPEWAFNGKGYGAWGDQTNFVNKTATGSYVTTKLTAAGTDKTIKIRLPKTAEVESAQMNVSTGSGVGTPGHLLVIYGDNPGYNFYSDIVNKMTAFSSNFTLVSSYNAYQNTPTWADIKDYSNIIIYSNGYYGYGFQNSASLGNLMADYVDAGGGLVIGMCLVGNSGSYNLGGRFASGGYNVMTPGSFHYYSGNSGYTITAANHPVMAGVSSLNWGYWGYTYISNQPSLPAGSKSIATFNYNGYQMAAEKTVSGVATVALNFYPLAYNTLGVGYMGDGDKLIRNALMYTGMKPISLSVDISDNGVVEYTNASILGNATITGFQGQLNAYLSKPDVTVSYTDAYGTEFVDVPVSITTGGAGTINASALQVTYTSKHTVDQNPDTGSLGDALNGLINPTADGGESNISIAVSSLSPGKVTVSDLVITYKPPDHWATIDTRSPEDAVVEMNENTSIDFKLTASDLYDYPMNITWYMDNMVVLKKVYDFTWFADFDANGSYKVKALVDNTLHKTEAAWTLIVKNVNRRPIIDTFAPDSSVVMDENSSTVFEVSASDPDQDALTYAWFLDNKATGTTDPSYEYVTNYFSAGQHTVKVVARDSGGANATNTWAITVTNVNAEPFITGATPAGNQVTMNENEVRKFTVTDLSTDGDKLSETWFLDGANTGQTGKAYNYSTDYNSSGNHVVEVRVTDGKIEVQWRWDVNVLDVNRPPVAVIASPTTEMEFLTWDAIALDGTPSWDQDGDPLNLTWTEGKKVLGSGTGLSVHLSRGAHTILLTASDGKVGGTSTAQVTIVVRYVEFDAVLTPSSDKVLVGNKIRLTVQLTNRGDAYVEELPVTFRVDGVNITTQSIMAVEPDTDFVLEFPWKATYGDHKLEVSVLSQSFSKTISVARPAAAKVDNSWMGQVAMLVVVLLVVVAVAAVAVMSRRKRPAAPMPAQQPYYDQRVQQPPAMAPSLPPPTPAPMGPVEDEPHALAAIKGTENVLAEAEKLGLDTARARQAFKVAQNFYEMGKYGKAIQSCKNAEGFIE